MEKIQTIQFVEHKIRNTLHTLALIAVMGGLMALVGYTIAGAEGLIWAALLGFFVMSLSPGFSPRLILKWYGARPIAEFEAPDLYEMVQTLSARAGLPAVPQLYYIPTKVMNAFTVGHRHNAVIGITDGLLNGLNYRELAGVLAHEISHIRNNDIRVMAIADMMSRFTGIFATVGQFLLFLNLPLLLSGEVMIPWPVILLLMGAPLVSDLLQLALSRTREFDADLDAARITGDPAGLASALQKLELQQGSIWGRVLLPGRRVPDPSILRTHPHTEARIQRLLQLQTDEELRYVHPAGGEMFAFSENLPRPGHDPRWRFGGLWY